MSQIFELDLSLHYYSSTNCDSILTPLQPGGALWRRPQRNHNTGDPVYVRYNYNIYIIHQSKHHVFPVFNIYLLLSILSFSLFSFQTQQSETLPFIAEQPHQVQPAGTAPHHCYRYAPPISNRPSAIRLPHTSSDWLSVHKLCDSILLYLLY